MKILLGENSGCCFGVKRAVKEAFNLSGKNNFVLGEIIHNESVVEKLNNSGVVTIDSIDDDRLKSGDTLLIRTHGEGEYVFNKAKDLGVNVIDCTCPFVKDIQNKVYEHYKNGYRIVIITALLSLLILTIYLIYRGKKCAL